MPVCLPLVYTIYIIYTHILYIYDETRLVQAVYWTRLQEEQTWILFYLLHNQ